MPVVSMHLSYFDIKDVPIPILVLEMPPILLKMPGCASANTHMYRSDTRPLKYISFTKTKVAVYCTPASAVYRATKSNRIVVLYCYCEILCITSTNVFHFS